MQLAPGASEADIRALLLAHDVSIVAGPTALGLYQVAIPDDADAAVIAQALSGNPLVIYLQEVPQP